MKLQELLNPRVSYQVLITFDLQGAQPAKYSQLRETLAEELELEVDMHLGKDGGNETAALPYNTLAALWTKDSTEQETRDHFKQKLLVAFKKHHLHGRYVILVAQNWAAAAGEF